MAICLAVALLATACGGLPASTPVSEGLPMDVGLLPPLRFQLEAPTPGAAPDVIVREFLTAAAQDEDGAAAGRAFLTTEAIPSWDLRSGVTVFAGTAGPTITVGPDATVDISVEARAVLDADGRYQELSGADRTRRARVRMARQGGEWRISSLPKGFGLWMQGFYFDRLYRPFRVRYASAADRVLVSDLRWMPLGAGLATRLARAQLDPVPAYLAGAVTTGFPSGTRLGVDAVTVESGTAVVELTGRVLDGSVAQRRMAWAQMLATLSELPEVLAVSLRVDGRRVELGDQAQPPETRSQLDYALGAAATPEQVVLRRGGALVAEDAKTLTTPADDGQPAKTRPARGLVAPSGPWRSLAASADLTMAAALGSPGDRVLWWRLDGGEVRSAPVGAALTRPAFDRHGFLWVGGEDDRGAGQVWALTAVSTSLAARRVSAPWLTGQQVIAVRPAADGQRAVVVFRAGGQGPTQVGVSGVARGADGEPLSLAAPMLIGAAVRQAREVSWWDDDSVVVLGTRGETATAGAIKVDLSGVSAMLAPLPDATALARAGGSQGLVACAKDGRVWRLAGSIWRQVGQAVVDIAAPGG